MEKPLAKTIQDVLNPLIPGDRPIALFDFPNHSNVGDSAIWLGELHYLQSRRLSSSVIFMADIATTRVRPLPTLPSDCIVLIHGGGNFGDLWPDHQRLRERLTERYKNQRVIQLPQSIHFEDFVAAEHSRNTFSTHKDFHLIVRDNTSLSIAQSLYDCNIHLCPDMALHLGSWPRPKPPSHDIFALLRTDKEKRGLSATDSAKSHDIAVDDWIIEHPSSVMRIDSFLHGLEANYPNHFTVPQPLRRKLYTQLAKQRMTRGCLQLAAGRVVISDRLHAHILCTLMGIPHVVLDNSYRKIGNFRDAWKTGEHLCRSATTLTEAIEFAREIIGNQ